MFWTRSDGAGKPQPLIPSKNVQYPRSVTNDGPVGREDAILASLGMVGAFALAPDGKRVAAILPSGTPGTLKAQNHVTFMLNFTDEIRRRLSAEGAAR